MVVSGHTHAPYVCDIKDPAGQDRLVTSASSFGRLFTETTLTYDRRTQDIVRASVEGANILVTRDVAEGPGADGDHRRVQERSSRPSPARSSATSHADVTARRTNAAGESALGDLIADAQLADASVGVRRPRSRSIAFMNPGGIRADLTYAGVQVGRGAG